MQQLKMSRAPSDGDLQGFFHKIVTVDSFNLFPSFCYLLVFIDTLVQKREVGLLSKLKISITQLSLFTSAKHCGFHFSV